MDISDKKIIINISRNSGSGGYEIGKKLSEKFDIPFYDKEVIEFAAKESGISKELFQAVDKQQTNSFLYSLAMGVYSYGGKFSPEGTVSMSDRLYLVQNDIIKDIANKGSCIIVGRCANYILRKYKCVNVFIYADIEKRIETICKRENLSESKAKDYINKVDKKRGTYYNYYSSAVWGGHKYNDMLIDSTHIGTDGCVEMIENLIKVKYQK